ncbi:hypothetical protein CCACVL1_03533 [Corchorus capsularis]|uniref:Uncharacterized protein n=1 Tax=Corchorus capsularis TaxID=210143 RepID=A0A1R3JYM2_COCAP|nr:hypothetical protein CCACVL1_03533 [Corchorus capsularis]
MARRFWCKKEAEKRSRRRESLTGEAWPNGGDYSNEGGSKAALA